MTESTHRPFRQQNAAGRWTGERGSGGTSLAYILLMPAVLLLIFGGIEFGLHNYARSLAVAAAHAGVRAATAAPASTTRGRLAAEDFLGRRAAGTLSDVTVTVTRSGVMITVMITAVAPSLIPLTRPNVVGEAAALIERLP